VKNRVILFGAIAFFGTLAGVAQQTTPSPTRKSAASSSHRAGGRSAEAKPSPTAGKPAGAATGAKAKSGSSDVVGGGDNNSAQGPTEITATQEAQFDTKTRSGVFIGNVKVIDPQFTMTADRLTVHLNRDEDGGGLREALAEGHVVIVHINQPKATDQAGQPSSGPTPAATRSAAASLPPGSSPGATPAQSQQPTTSVGKGDTALYEAKDGSVTLTGWPTVTQAGNTHIATSPVTKMILFRDGRMQTYGSTRTLIEDKSTTGNSNANGTH
jgi:lipopolysaccharide export system protein LptA